MKRLFLTLFALPILTLSNLNAQSNCQAEFAVINQCPYFEFVDTSSATSNIVDWYYDFGDGFTSNLQQNPVYTYNADGVYTVCLYITTADSCTSMFCDTIVVDCLGTGNCIDPAIIDTNIFCPQVIDPVCGCDSVTYDNSCIAENYYGVTSWTAGPCGQQSGCNAGFIIDDSVSMCPSFQFIDVSTGNFAVVEWSYDFGDGGTSTSQHPYHTYQSNGVYSVCLYITTADSCTSWFCDEVVVDCFGQGSGCQTSFWINDSVSQCPTYEFIDQSTANFSIGEWFYDFGDGTTSTDQNPTHTFTSNGTYTICLTTTAADSCVSSYCETIVVNCLASLEEEVLNEMTLSPNPASSAISLKLNQSTQIQYRIYGMNGRIYDLGERPSSLQHQFDVSNLAQGMYLLEVNAANQREILRFIKE